MCFESKRIHCYTVSLVGRKQSFCLVRPYADFVFVSSHIDVLSGDG